jgi:hypothetical protein
VEVDLSGVNHVSVSTLSHTGLVRSLKQPNKVSTSSQHHSTDLVKKGGTYIATLS